MKTSINIITIAIAVLLLAGCTSTVNINKSRKPELSFQAGINHGGVVENTDMSLLPASFAPPEATVDAFTGATSLGAHAGVHIVQPLGRIGIETGIDYLYSYQQFNYIDAGQFAMGQRDLRVSQFAVPVRLEFHLLRAWLPDAGIRFRIGYTGELNAISVMNSGVLPEYNLHRWSNGASVGLSFFPFRIGNDHRLGAYVDLYRGSIAFEDYYNQSGFEEPGTSFIKTGIAFKF